MQDSPEGARPDANAGRTDGRPQAQNGSRAAGQVAGVRNQTDNILHVLSAGAAEAVVVASRVAFAHPTRLDIHANFGAVGTIKAKFLAGEPCDVVILTAALIDELVYAGGVRAGTAVALGRVRTGVATRAGVARLETMTTESLRQALVESTAVYVPDTGQSTAGIHVAKILRTLGIADEISPRLRMHPNGLAAMRALAASGDDAAIGITQVTEINNEPGVRLASLLPVEFELATVYSAGIGAGARQPAAAQAFITWLTGPASVELRRASGFED